MGWSAWEQMAFLLRLFATLRNLIAEADDREEKPACVSEFSQALSPSAREFWFGCPA